MGYNQYNVMNRVPATPVRENGCEEGDQNFCKCILSRGGSKKIVHTFLEVIEVKKVTML